ncbi:hypothetical protein JD969_06270 [Planctomycetota bacterium]|nr:hypothetical protein JD969_06270 [Planctomycetota bacterium]
MKKLVSLFVLALVFATNLRADDILHYVPKDVDVFLHWRSGKVVGDTFKESNLGRISKHSDYQKSIKAIVGTIKDMATDDDGFSGFTWMFPFLNELENIGEGEFVFFLRSLEEEEYERSPVLIQIGIICKGGDGMKGMRRYLKDFAAQSTTNIRVTEEDDVYGVLFGGDPKSVLRWESEETCVLSNPLHQEIYASDEVQVMIAGFVNTMGLMNAMFDVGFIDRDDAISMKEMGLWGLRAIIFSEGFNDGRWDSNGVFITVEDREAMLQILDGHKEINQEMLKVVPVDAIYVNTWQLNLKDYFPKMVSLLSHLDKPMVAEFTLGMAYISSALKINMMTDVVAQIQNGYVTYCDRVKGYDLGYGMCIVSQLDDPESANKTAYKILQNLSSFEITPKQWENEDGLFCEIDETFIGISYGHLVIAYDRGVLDRAVAQLKSPSTSILDNEKFIESRTYFGDSNGTSLIFSDLEASAPEFAAYYQKTDRAASKIRLPYRRVARYLDYMGATVWIDENSLGWSMVSPFPFAYFYSPISLDDIGFVGIDSVYGIFEAGFDAGNATGKRLEREQKARREAEKAAGSVPDSNQATEPVE